MVVVHNLVFRITQVLATDVPDDAHVYQLPVFAYQVASGAFLQNKQAKEID